MFDYNKSFKRNIGWITEQEQQTMREATFAIGGLGGVGGDHAITLARMGCENFHIADLDDYDYSNFNRQAGANINTVGKSKSGVMEKTIMEINPNAKIKNFTNGIQDDNLDEFLEGVDVYVDSLDIFAVDIRRKTFQRCHDLKIPALTAGPMGMGVAFLSFIPGKGMSFQDYFGMKDPSATDLAKLNNDPVAEYILRLEHYIDNIIRFIVGVSPSVQQRHYLVDTRRVDFFRKDLPSTKMGIDLASGTLCTNVLKVVLQRGDVIHAPHGLHFDAYLNKLKKTWRPLGHNNPMLSLMRRYIKSKLEINEKINCIKDNLELQYKNGTLKKSYTEEDMHQMLQSFSQ